MGSRPSPALPLYGSNWSTSSPVDVFPLINNMVRGYLIIIIIIIIIIFLEVTIPTTDLSAVQG